MSLSSWLVEQSDGLNDHVVALVDVELDLGATVRVAETELGLVAGCGSEAFDELGE